MLRRLAIEGFKSLHNVDLHLPRFTVLVGPNTAGKSNILDAVQALSRIGTTRTLAEALRDPIRGYPIESFTFPGALCRISWRRTGHGSTSKPMWKSAGSDIDAGLV